jgi:hypothetical protein
LLEARNNLNGDEFVELVQQVNVAASPIGITVLIGFGYQPRVSGIDNLLLSGEQAGGHGNSPHLFSGS